MGDIGGIVESIAIVKQLLTFAQVAESPEFFEPCDVADFPERRIHRGQLWADQLRIVEVHYQIEGASPELAHDRDQPRRVLEESEMGRNRHKGFRSTYDWM